MCFWNLTGNPTCVQKVARTWCSRIFSEWGKQLALWGLLSSCRFLFSRHTKMFCLGRQKVFRHPPWPSKHETLTCLSLFQEKCFKEGLVKTSHQERTKRTMLGFPPLKLTHPNPYGGHRAPRAAATFLPAAGGCVCSVTSTSFQLSLKMLQEKQESPNDVTAWVNIIKQFHNLSQSWWQLS